MMHISWYGFGATYVHTYVYVSMSISSMSTKFSPTVIFVDLLWVDEKNEFI
jgi:hypothetical protein